MCVAFIIMDRSFKLKIDRNFVCCLLAFVAQFTLFACRPQPLNDSILELSPSPSVTNIEIPQKILFIGNSFTYYNGGVDKHLERLAASANPPIRLLIGSQTTPSQTLKGHYHDHSTKRALALQRWDVVILQGASYEPVDQSAQKEFFEFARRLNEDIEEIGARTVFFMTWAWRYQPDMIGHLEYAYVKQGNEIGALVVPVGLAWAQVLKDHPEMLLYSDSRHSNLEGTYLAACVFYAALLGRSPVGLSYTAGIEVGEAIFLQQTAWETTQLFYQD